MALARPRRHLRPGSPRCPRRRPAGSRRPRPSPRTAASSPCAGCAAQGPGPSAPGKAPAPGRAPGAAGPGWARAPERLAGWFQMRARCGLRSYCEPDCPRMWAPKQETGLGLRWRPRRLREVARVSGTGAGGCQRRCGGAAAAARRGLLAGTAPLQRAPPTADTGPAPSVAPPILPHSAVLPEPEAPPPNCVAPGHAHSLVVPPTTGLLGFLGSIDWRPAALAPPRSRWTTPSPVQGPAAPPDSDFLPGDKDRRAASDTRLADAAAEPARPLKGTSRLSSARFLL